jgi:hypothetical protein
VLDPDRFRILKKRAEAGADVFATPGQPGGRTAQWPR